MSLSSRSDDSLRRLHRYRHGNIRERVYNRATRDPPGISECSHTPACDQIHRAEKWMKADEQANLEGNFDALEQLTSSDVKFHLLNGPSFTGFEIYKQHIMNNRESNSPVKAERQYITGDGNVFVMSFKSTSISKVSNPRVQIPAGATVNTDAMFAFRIENSRVAELWIKVSATIS